LCNAPLAEFLTLSEDRLISPAERAAAQAPLGRTEVAQPLIVLTSLLYSRLLGNLGVAPDVVAGHSLGELTALYQAGAFGEADLLRLAALRGRCMAEGPPGAMAALACPAAEAERLLRRVEGYAVVANRNGPRQTVVSGDAAAVQRVAELAAAEGVGARRLPVGHAFHSDRVRPAAEHFRRQVRLPARPGPPAAEWLSGVTGRPARPPLDLADHLARQIAAPVDFLGVVDELRGRADVVLEVGPGHALSDLVNDALGRDACLPVGGDPSLDDRLNAALACCFAHGLNLDWPRLYEPRLVRPCRWAEERVFLENPCERPLTGEAPAVAPLRGHAPAPTPESAPSAQPVEDLLRELVSRRTGYPADAIGREARLLDDLHLDSIKAADLVAAAAQALGVPGTLDAGALANARLDEVAAALRERARDRAAPPPANDRPHGGPGKPDDWVRTFVVEYIPDPG
jgi:enediyne polyketide synthase